MAKNQCWVQTGNQLVAALPIRSSSDAQNAVAQYESVLQQWQTLVHPAILRIDDFSVSFREFDGDKCILESSILPAGISHFKPSNIMLSSLSTFEKLFIVRQTIDVDLYVQQNSFNLLWEMPRLYIHQTGISGWLPPLPNDLKESPDASSKKEGMIRFLFALFDLEVGEVKNWRDLQKEAKIPWEWGAFIEYYLAAKVDAQIDIIKVFSFVFYQSWLYTTANRLGMKDKLLTRNAYDMLYQFGINLGLSDNEIQALNIIAQQQNPSWEDLVVIFDGK